MLIHRYVLFNVSVACLGTVLMFAFILLVGEVTKDMLTLLAQGRLSLGGFVTLTGIIFPYVFIYALPMGTLTGVLLAMGRMSAQSEIVALRSAGISVTQLSSSVFVFAVLCSAISILVNFEIGPKARSEYRSELADTIRRNPLGFIVEKSFVTDFPGYVLHVGKKEGETLSDFRIWALDKRNRATALMTAEHGYFRYDPNNNMLNLILRNGSYEFMDDEDPEDFKKPPRKFSFEESPLQFSLDGIIGRATAKKKLYWMSSRELMGEWRRLKALSRQGESEARSQARRGLFELKMAIHEKLALSYSTLSLALLAVPLGIVVQRKETSANLFIALGLAFAYFILMTGAGWLESKPWLRPHLLFWVPNFLFQGLGLWLIHRVDFAKLKGRSKPEAGSASA